MTTETPQLNDHKQSCGLASADGKPACIMPSDSKFAEGNAEYPPMHTGESNASQIFKPRKRMPHIDAIKGISILIVVIDHCGYTLPPILDHIEVPTFFIISGFLFRNTSFSNIIKKKTIHLIIPYAIFSCIFLPYLLWQHIIAKTVPLYTIFTNIFIYPINAPLWFLKTLFWIFIIYYGLVKLSTYINKEHYKNITVILSLFFAIIGRYAESSHPLLLATGLPQAVVAIPIFVAGNYLSEVSIFHNKNKNIRLKGILIILCGMIYYFTANSTLQLHIAKYNSSTIIFYICSISAFVFLATSLSFIQKFHIIHIIGKNSILILGLHFPIILLLQSIGIYNRIALAILTFILLIFTVKIIRKCTRFNNIITYNYGNTTTQ